MKFLSGFILFLEKGGGKYESCSIFILLLQIKSGKLVGFPSDTSTSWHQMALEVLEKTSGIKDDKQETPQTKC
jgi:hypothetical protein